MMETDLIPAMSVFTIIIHLLKHGRKLEQTLMGKQYRIKVAALFLYLLTDQEWLLEHLLMMEMEILQGM